MAEETKKTTTRKKRSRKKTAPKTEPKVEAVVEEAVAAPVEEKAEPAPKPEPNPELGEAYSAPKVVKARKGERKKVRCIRSCRTRYGRIRISLEEGQTYEFSAEVANWLVHTKRCV